MHISHGCIPLQLSFDIYFALLVGILGGCLSFCLAMMAIYRTGGIELTLGLHFVVIFGLVRLLMPPWSTITDEQDLQFSFDGNHNNNNYRAKMLCELAVDTRTFGEENKEHDPLFPSPTSRNSSCSICLQSFESGQEVSVVNHCKHTLHSECLQMWVQKSATCPYCRQDLEKKPRVEEEFRNGERRNLPGDF